MQTDLPKDTEDTSGSTQYCTSPSQNKVPFIENLPPVRNLQGAPAR